MLLLTGCGSRKRVVVRGLPDGGGDVSSVAVDSRYTSSIADPMGRALVEEAVKWIGTAYRYGGQTREGTDCSGLVMSLYRDVCNVKIPRSTTEQRAYCSRLSSGREQIGDLMFFGSGTDPMKVSHVGLYIGDGRMIHASSSRGVVVSSITSGYWAERFKGAGRVDAAPLAWADVHGKSKVAAPAPVASAATPAPEATAVATPVPPSAVEIDLLDIIINQKLDSIFSTQFMD